MPPPLRHAWALLALLSSPVFCPAAGPPPVPTARDQLLRFVPDDVGFCLVVQDLRAHAADLLASPLAQQFRRSAFGASLAASEEWRQLAKVDKDLVKLLGVGWAGLRDDVLGDAVVFAYRPGPPDKPDREQGLILVRARSGKTLAALVDKLNKAQKESGELKALAEREHKGVKYYRRAEHKEVNFYLLRGPVLVFTGQEEMLRRAIENDQAAGVAAPPPVARRLRELGLDQALAALWVNPRAFDALVVAKGKDDPALKTFAACWKALRGVGLGAHLDKDLTLSLAVRARAEDLPAPLRRFLAEAAKPSEVWRAFPDDALFAAGGRVDAAALFAALGEFMSKKGREKLEADLERSLGAVLGKNVVKEVLPALGPDWGACVTAPPADDKAWSPRVVLALRVGAGGGDPPVDKAVLSALHFWAAGAVLAHNRVNPDRPLRLRTVAHDKKEIKYLEGDRAFPPGVRPAFAAKGGYVVLGSSPEVVRAFGVTGPAPAGDVPLLRVSFKHWREYLKGRRDALAGALAEREGVSKEKALARVDALRESLGLLDRLELRQRTAAGQVTLTLTVQPAKPLKK